jgi:hypothetical protein
MDQSSEQSSSGQAPVGRSEQINKDAADKLLKELVESIEHPLSYRHPDRDCNASCSLDPATGQCPERLVNLTDLIHEVNVGIGIDSLFHLVQTSPIVGSGASLVNRLELEVRLLSELQTLVNGGIGTVLKKRNKRLKALRSTTPASEKEVPIAVAAGFSQERKAPAATRPLGEPKRAGVPPGLRRPSGLIRVMSRTELARAYSLGELSEEELTQELLRRAFQGLREASPAREQKRVG